jgi:hypothetical protein
MKRIIKTIFTDLLKYIKNFKYTTHELLTGNTFSQLLCVSERGQLHFVLILLQFRSFELGFSGSF